MKRILLFVLIAATIYLPGFAQDTTIARADAIPITTTLDTTISVPPVSVMKKAKRQKPGQVYTLNPGADITISAIAAGWSAYAFTKIYSKDPSSPEQIAGLRDEDVPGFDRW